MKASLAKLRAVAPGLFAVAIALVWLNQGATLADYQDLETRLFVEGGASVGERARFPFSFLYRRSGDEELYHATARAIRGLPCDEWMLTEARGPTPEEFRRTPPADGRWHVPYREVAIEYPALMLPFILLPSFFAGDLGSYARIFGAIMGACLVLGCWFCIRARTWRGEDERRRAWWLASALMLAQGGLAIQRLDAVIALALGVAVWAASRQKMVLLGASLGLAAAAKFVPLLLVPALVASSRRDLRGTRQHVVFASAFSAFFAIGLFPMLAMSPGSIASVLGYHANRGLQVESTFATLVGVGRLLTGAVVPASVSYGSYNLTGFPTNELARIATPLMLLGAAFVTRAAWRTSGENGKGESAALVLLASLASVWLFGKVFSPQYLTWALPVVLALSPRADRRIVWIYFAALVLTQVYLRGYYDYVYDQSAIGIATLLVRQMLIAALATLVFRAMRRRTPPTPWAMTVARMSRERRIPVTGEVDARGP